MRQPRTTECLIESGESLVPSFCNSGREAVYGGGVSPIGWKANFFRSRRLQPFGAISVGLVSSVRPVPLDVPGGTRLNFTFDFQAGFQLFEAARSHSWTIGYKLEHISNAYRSNVNPGVDANLIFVGYSFYR
ncbi:MAG: acyloxyacyl hydrolase [Candidatus Acidiferrales bacterium]